MLRIKALRGPKSLNGGGGGVKRNQTSDIRHPKKSNMFNDY